METFTDAAWTALRALATLPVNTLVLWGLVRDTDGFMLRLKLEGIGTPPDAWIAGPGDSRLLLAENLRREIFMTDIFETISGSTQLGRFAVALVDGGDNSVKAVSVAASGWDDTIEVFDDGDAPFHHALPPQNQTLLERFGQEPFTFARTSHMLLAHTHRWG